MKAVHLTCADDEAAMNAPSKWLAGTMWSFGITPAELQVQQGAGFHGSSAPATVSDLDRKSRYARKMPG
jgi:hypothetical protein